MQGVAELLVQNTWVVGLAAVLLTAGLAWLLRARGTTVTAKRIRAWAQGLICIMLAAATEYLRAAGAGESFSVNQALLWAQANVGVSLVVYRAGKRAWEVLKGLLLGAVDETNGEPS